MPRPLRLLLYFDPVFLELGRCRDDGRWGPLRGLSLFAAVPDTAGLREILAFLHLFLGPPSKSFCTLRPGAAELVHTYDGSAAVHLTASMVPQGLPAAGILCGSASFDHAMAEFRWGNEGFLAYSTQEGESVRVNLEDPAYEGADSAISAEREAEAAAFAMDVLAAGEGGGDGRAEP